MEPCIVCPCGADLVFVSANTSITETAKGERLVTRKENWKCWSCHRSAQFVLDSGDDPYNLLGEKTSEPAQG